MLTRLLFFAYGAACYLIFLATFLYAIAFVGGFAVPTRLDDDAAELAGRRSDDRWRAPGALRRSAQRHGEAVVQGAMDANRPVDHRALHVCVVREPALLLLFWQWRPIGIQIWSVENGVARAALWTLFAAGWATVLTVTFLINHFDLFGLRQVWLPLVGRPYTRVPLRTPLPYRFVRHPLYFGFLLAFWMTPTMTLAHLVFALVTTVYIVLAIQFEERDLVAEHGAAYEEYRRSVPMLLPGPRARSAMRRHNSTTPAEAVRAPRA